MEINTDCQKMGRSLTTHKLSDLGLRIKIECTRLITCSTRTLILIGAFIKRAKDPSHGFYTQDHWLICVARFVKKFEIANGPAGQV
jgi:hypothetical protein